MDSTLITLFVALILVIAAGMFFSVILAAPDRRELEKRNELELRFKKMELEAARKWPSP
ncbi:MAG: hypothetical protein R3F19_15700 [Verrucomicrobiales bacterium]